MLGHPAAGCTVAAVAGFEEPQVGKIVTCVATICLFEDRGYPTSFRSRRFSWPQSQSSRDLGSLICALNLSLELLVWCSSGQILFQRQSMT